MRLGIVTCTKCRHLIASEQALLPLLAHKSIQGIPVVWNDPQIDWKAFDALLVRSIWDYHLYPAEFQKWLSDIERLEVPIWNPVHALRWNHHKFYLRELQHLGVPIVPTLFLHQGQGDAKHKAQLLGWRAVVVKPAISASGYRTKVVDLTSPGAENILLETSQFGDHLVQPFMPEIQQSGEVSLIFFDHKFSHAVLKRPRPGEFRVQAEYGGHEVPFAAEPGLVEQARRVLESSGFKLLYARVDGVVVGGEFRLMELELIEPDLFLETWEGSGTTLVNSLVEKLNQHGFKSWASS